MKRKITTLMLSLLLASSLVIPAFANQSDDLTLEISVLNQLNNAVHTNIPNLEQMSKKACFNVVLDGTMVADDVDKKEQPIMNQDGVMYISLRMLETILPGMQLDYNASTKVVKAELDGNKLYLQLGKKVAYYGVEDMQPYMFTDKDKPAMAYNKTFLPLRFVTEKLGCQVLWDSATYTVSLSSTEQAPTIPEGITKPQTSAYYLGGQPYQPLAGQKMESYIDSRIAVSLSEKTTISVDVRTMATPPEDEVRKGYYYAGGVTIMDLYNPSEGDNLTTQYALAEKIFAPFLTQNQIKEIMTGIKKDFSIDAESPSRTYTYGDLIVEVYSSRKMIAHENIVLYKKNSGLYYLI